LLSCNSVLVVPISDRDFCAAVLNVRCQMGIRGDRDGFLQLSLSGRGQGTVFRE
jgi:hypothetical protein